MSIDTVKGAVAAPIMPIAAMMSSIITIPDANIADNTTSTGIVHIEVKQPQQPHDGNIIMLVIRQQGHIQAIHTIQNIIEIIGHVKLNMQGAQGQHIVEIHPVQHIIIGSAIQPMHVCSVIYVAIQLKHAKLQFTQVDNRYRNILPNIK